MQFECGKARIRPQLWFQSASLRLCCWILYVWVWMALEMELPGTACKGLAGGCWWQEATKAISVTMGTISRPEIQVASLPLGLPPARTVPCPERWGGDVITGWGSTAVPYAGTTCAQEPCYAHQPPWSAASWKGWINHALILMGQKVPAFPFYSFKGLPFLPLPLNHGEIFLVPEKQIWKLVRRREYAQIISPECLG